MARLLPPCPAPPGSGPLLGGVGDRSWLQPRFPHVQDASDLQLPGGREDSCCSSSGHHCADCGPGAKWGGTLRPQPCLLSRLAESWTPRYSNGVSVPVASSSPCREPSACCASRGRNGQGPPGACLLSVRCCTNHPIFPMSGDH